MNEHDIAEQAYKNGYEAGVKELRDKLVEIAERNYIVPLGMCVGLTDIYNIAKELTGGSENECDRT